MFLHGTVPYQAAAWHFVGVGIRKIQDVGAHRKKMYSGKPTVEQELWKKAFWLLLLFDRMGSARLGRMCCTYQEE